jgi:hypothetical protein
MNKLINVKSTMILMLLLVSNVILAQEVTGVVTDETGP